MNPIKNVVFDFGGVIISIDYHQALKHCADLGLPHPEQLLDPYTQSGIFGDLESGKLSEEAFRKELSLMAGRELSWQDCQYVFLGYFKALPPQNLEMLRRLRAAGYRLILLSNTNPFMMEWAMSDRFDGQGHSLREYFDKAYLSYECGLMKPDPALFSLICHREAIQPSESLFVDDGEKNTHAASLLGFQTLCPPDGTDWTEPLGRLLRDKGAFPLS